MSDSEIEHHHLQIDVPKRVWIGWKRYKDQFKNASEAFVNLSEVRMNQAPGHLTVQQEDNQTSRTS